MTNRTLFSDTDDSVLAILAQLDRFRKRDTKMFKVIRVASAVFGLSMLMSPLAVADPLGVSKWEDNVEGSVYEFLPNNEFHFSGVRKVWVPFQGFTRFWTPEGRAGGRYVSERDNFTGAWESKENICSTTQADAGKVSGNLKLYVGSLECCMEVRLLGNTLLLRAIAVKGEGPDACATRTLRQSQSKPESNEAPSAARH